MVNLMSDIYTRRYTYAILICVLLIGATAVVISVKGLEAKHK